MRSGSLPPRTTTGQTSILPEPERLQEDAPVGVRKGNRREAPGSTRQRIDYKNDSGTFKRGDNGELKVPRRGQGASGLRGSGRLRGLRRGAGREASDRPIQDRKGLLRALDVDVGGFGRFRLLLGRSSGRRRTEFA